MLLMGPQRLWSFHWENSKLVLIKDSDPTKFEWDLKSSLAQVASNSQTPNLAGSIRVKQQRRNAMWGAGGGERRESRESREGGNK